jgi:hypothetical protein
VDRRVRVGFVPACLLVFALVAAVLTWGTPSPDGPEGGPPVTVTLASGAPRPAALTVTDLDTVEELQARFSADQGHPRLVLALAPT